MDAARWERIQTLFHAVADLPPNEQAAALDAARADDPSLVADVLALLREDVGANSVLDRGLADAALRMLDRIDRPASQRSLRTVPHNGVARRRRDGRRLPRRSATTSGRVAAIKILRDATGSRRRGASASRSSSARSRSSITRPSRRLLRRRRARRRDALVRHGVRRGRPAHGVLPAQRAPRSPSGCGSSARSARRCSTRTGTSSSTATSSRRTSS